MSSHSETGGIIRRFLLLFVLAVFGVVLAGCDDGDDGRDGVDGADGADGAPGLACWDLNENGIGDPAEDLNGDGFVDVLDCSGAAVDQAVSGDLSNPDTIAALIEEGEPIVATIDGVTIASPPVVDLTITDSEGNPLRNLTEAGSVTCAIAKLVPAANGFPSMWQSYTNQLETDQDWPDVPPSPNLLTQALQARAEPGTVVDNLDGTYTFTFTTDVANVTDPVPVTYEPSLTHKVGCEIRFNDDEAEETLPPDNPTFLFVPDGSADPSTKAIAATESCNNCHDRLAIHGNGRFTTEYCQNCHNPYTRDQDFAELLDLSHMVHSIHASAVRRDQETVEDEYSYKVLGFGERFAGVFATDDFSEVTYPQDVRYCESCHNAANPDTPDAGDWLVTATAEVCGACHISGLVVNPEDPTTGLSTYEYLHVGPTGPTGAQVPSGACENCHGTNGFVATDEVHVRSGEPLRAKLAEAFQLEILGATNVAPGDTPVITIRVTNPEDGSAYDIVNDPEFDSVNNPASLNLYVAWTTDDIYNGDETGALLGARSDTGVPADPAYPFRMVIEDIQAAAAASGQNADGSYDITYFTALPTGYTGDVMIGLGGHPAANAGTDAAPVWDRAAATSTVFYPGKTRVIAVDPDKCANCHAVLQAHGSNRNYDVRICLVCHNNDGSIDDNGTIFGYGFGYMIHNIHAASDTYIDGAFAEVTFPQDIDNCEACHKPNEGDSAGNYNVARATARAVSTNPGADALGRWDDDIATTANAAICGTCHSDSASAGHFQTNGGFIDVTKDPGLLGNPPTGQEACAVCHGAGSSFDTTLFHGD